MANRDVEVDKKLDMSLDDLVVKERHRDGPRHREREASRSPYRERRRDSRGDRDFGRDSGKGKGKRRMLPEDKALQNTRCFFNSEGQLVVRLYDTEVFTARKKPAGEAPQDAPGATDSKPMSDANPTAPQESTAAANDNQSDATPTAPQESSAAADTNQMSDATPAAPQDAKPAEPEASSPAAPVASSEPAAPVASSEPAAPAADGKPSVSEENKTAGDKKPATVDESAAVKEADSEAAPSKEAASEEAATSGDGKPAEPSKDPDAAPPAAQGAADAAKTKADATQDKPAGAGGKSGIVVVLNSGTFRTVETKYIINEAAGPLSIRILHKESNSWTVGGDGVEKELPFEDKMELHLKSDPACLDTVKQRMDTKIAESKDRDRHGHRRRGDYDAPRDRDYHRMPPAAPPGWRPGMPPMGQPHWPHNAPPLHHWPPPPGWPGAPPHGAWGAPPPHHNVPPQHGAPPWDARGQHHRPPVYGAATTAAPAPAPRGPLPDSMFQ